MLSGIMILMSDFRAILKRHREKRGLTKAALAQKLDVSSVIISNFEAEKTKNKYTHPNFSHFKKLCNALDLNEGEQLEMALSCCNARLSDDARSYIDFINERKGDLNLSILSNSEIKELIKSKFEPLFDNKKIVNLLYDEKVLKILNLIDSMPENNKQKKLSLILQILDS